jgi:hypothetical protein
MTTDEVISSLHPAFQPIARRILDIGQKQMPKGSKLIFTDGMRTVAEQAAALASGKSKVSIGWHNYGLGLDFGIIDETGAYVTNGRDARYTAVGYICKSSIVGLIWGGDWADPDYDHFEWHPGFTMAIYQAWLAQNPPPEVPEVTA